MSDSIIHWPAPLSNNFNLSTVGELSSAQATMNAAGEKFAFLVNFDGSAIESISIPLVAGTAATTIDLEIQAPDTTANSNDVSAMPDGTAITNGSASVSSKGGASEWVTWTFGTSPTPSGLHWVVVIPSGGSFDVKIALNQDWAQGTTREFQFAQQRLYTTAWSGGVSVGVAILRVKKTSGDYLYTGRPPFSTTGGDTFNSRSYNGTSVIGAKFTAPFDMDVCAIGISGTMGVFHYVEVVLVDSTDTELARSGFSSEMFPTYGPTVGISQTSITEGSAYRVYLVSPTGATHGCRLNTVTITSGDYDKLNLASGDWEYTTASDPPSEGGVGTWTDTATEIPLMYLMGLQNPADLAGGGGGGAVQTSHTFAF